jgi:molybdenum cofactor guanylyltransferase
MVSKEQVDGLILCGGQGQRMGGRDKGLIACGEQTLVARSAANFAPQVRRIMLNANRHLDQYNALGYPVYEDLHPGFQGPLAGFAVGLRYCTAPYLAIIPCDTPDFPADMVAKLFGALASQTADLSYPITYDAHQRKQTHPVFCVMRSYLFEKLNQFLKTDQRRIDRWYAELQCIEVVFNDHQAFTNINTPADLSSLTTRLCS